MKVPSDWLLQRVDEAPTTYVPTSTRTSPLRTRMAWQKMKSRAHLQDEIWAFANPSDRLGRHLGFALVRQGAVVDSVVVD